jgi:hypothetical protein
MFDDSQAYCAQRCTYITMTKHNNCIYLTVRPQVLKKNFEAKNSQHL